MPVMDGLVFAEAVPRMLPSVPIVVVTGLEERETVARLKDVGVDKILSKPFTVGRLSEVLKDAFSA